MSPVGHNPLVGLGISPSVKIDWLRFPRFDRQNQILRSITKCRNLYRPLILQHLICTAFIRFRTGSTPRFLPARQVRIVAMGGYLYLHKYYNSNKLT
jgi:hypothetical protein